MKGRQPLISKTVSASLLLYLLIFCLANSCNATAISHKPVHASKKPVVVSAKDVEIAKLQAQVRELQADLVRAQAQIDSLETASVSTPKNATEPAVSAVTVADIKAQRFSGSDAGPNPIWVVTYEIKNGSEQTIPFPRVYLNCNDNTIGNASRYVGHSGMTVVDPYNISPEQDIHLKYAWVPLSESETPVTITVDLGSSSIVEPVTVTAAP